MNKLLKRLLLLVCIGVGVGAILWCFPTWEYDIRSDKPPKDDYSYAHKARVAPRWKKPANDAEFKEATLTLYLSIDFIVTFVGCLMLYAAFERQRQQQAARYWRQQWETTSMTQDTLLRASAASDIPAQTLLRAAADTQRQTEPAEQLLRSSSSS